MMSHMQDAQSVSRSSVGAAAVVFWSLAAWCLCAAFAGPFFILMTLTSIFTILDLIKKPLEIATVAGGMQVLFFFFSPYAFVLYGFGIRKIAGDATQSDQTLSSADRYAIAEKEAGSVDVVKKWKEGEFQIDEQNADATKKTLPNENMRREMPTTVFILVALALIELLTVTMLFVISNKALYLNGAFTLIIYLVAYVAPVWAAFLIYQLRTSSEEKTRKTWVIAIASLLVVLASACVERTFDGRLRLMQESISSPLVGTQIDFGTHGLAYAIGCNHSCSSGEISKRITTQLFCGSDSGERLTMGRLSQRVQSVKTGMKFTVIGVYRTVDYPEFVRSEMNLVHLRDEDGVDSLLPEFQLKPGSFCINDRWE